MEVVSDVVPGYKGPGKEGFLDNSSVPLAARPWRHDPDNWLDYTSRQGCFLHIPVIGGILGNVPALVARIKAARPEVICWGNHPHEFQNPDGSICLENVALLEAAMETLDRELKPDYMSMDEYRRQA